mmetsp:Transcript_16404/g.33694  ORF Transcript_16404/g.33694 Transcript_16404/m.33694 type:complete len:485 (-) Transcript_16404:96-1550(-)
MPSANSSRQHPQRRIFRGRGGPTDGNIPRPKTPRIRVKYQHQPEDRGRDNHDDDVADCVHDSSSLDVSVDQPPLSLNQQQSNGDNIRSSPLPPPNLSPADEQFLKEIRHLQTRIQNVTLAIQTSRGIANPKIWQENVLIPVKNVLKEWRAILSFHCEERCDSNNDDNNDDIDVSPHDDVESGRDRINGSDFEIVEATTPTPDTVPILPLNKHQQVSETYPRVFCLLQMSIQTGPLVGSNPGYFKRCGGDVATMAFEFLTEVVNMADNGEDFDIGGIKDDFAEVEFLLNGFEMDEADESLDAKKKRMDELKNGETSNCNAIENNRAENNYELDAGEEINNAMKQSEIDESDLESNEESESCFSSESESEIPGKLPENPLHEKDEFSSDEGLDMVTTQQATTPNDTNKAKSTAVMTNLQRSYCFSIKQSQAIHTWLNNAQKAMEKNKDPSKSAKRLQSQKGKKARMKELKKERQLKKKLKGKGKKG